MGWLGVADQDFGRSEHLHLHTSQVWCRWWAAWKDGKVTLDEDAVTGIVGRRIDAVWGSMRYERSLAGILGKEGAKYYKAPAVSRISFYRPVLGEIKGVEDALRIGRDRSIGWAINEKNLLTYYLPKFNLKDDVKRTLGLWGTPEPSFNAWITGRREDVIAMAKAWGKSYNQDAVALLLPNPKGEGGVLRWDFSRQLKVTELDQLLGGVRAVNDRLARMVADGIDTGGLDMVGLTVLGKRRVEFWVGDQVALARGRILLADAIRMSGLDLPEPTFEGGYDFLLLLGGSDY